jgi:hypothetical protein
VERVGGEVERAEGGQQAGRQGEGVQHVQLVVAQVQVGQPEVEVRSDVICITSLISTVMHIIWQEYTNPRICPLPPEVSCTYCIYIFRQHVSFRIIFQ